MQGQGWSGAPSDQQSFNNAFYGVDDSNSGLNVSQEAFQSLYGHHISDDMASVFGNYHPTSSSHNTYSHPAQMMTPQASDSQMQSNARDGNVGSNANNVQHFSSQMMNNLNTAASTAAAAAYGHLGYNNSASTYSSNGVPQNSHAGLHNEWRPSSMDGYNQPMVNTGGTNPLQAHGNFHGSLSGYERESGTGANDSGAGTSKRRRMTVTTSFGNHSRPSGGQSDHLQSDSSASNHEFARQPYRGSDDQGHLPSRPPLLHRRSRSGSEVQGSIRKNQSDSSYYADVASHGFPSKNSFAGTPFAAAQEQTPSFMGSQPSMTLGGHAASHPPGLGSHILRGVDVSASGSSAATDFTKRKGWTGRVVEELLDFVHVLDPEGTILYASPSVQSLTGWRSEELKGRKLSEFVHPQDVVSVEREIDRMRLGKGELLTYYRFKVKPSTSGNSSKTHLDNDSSAGDTAEEKQAERRSEVEHADAFTREGDYIVFEATGHPYFPPEPITVRSNGASDIKEETTSPWPDSDSRSVDPGDARIKSEPVSTTMSETEGSQPLSQTHSRQTPLTDLSGGGDARSTLQCFFCSARPYPSKNTSMLDSFLELKLENERLRLMIADMDLSGAEREHDRSEFAAAYHPDLLKQELEREGSTSTRQMPVNAMFGSATVYADGSTSDMSGQRKSGQYSRRNSLGSHPTSPTMRSGVRDEDVTGFGVTNLNESEDDQSNLNTSATAAAVAGTAEGERRKKPKQDDSDHVCTDCGRVDSPEWRKGPLGPKTLCNACGLRWAKKIKRKGGDPTAAAVSGGLAPVPGMQPQHLLSQGQMPTPLSHTHQFHRSESGQLSGIAMVPSSSMSSMSGMNMGTMMSHSPPGFASMPSFDDSQQNGGHR